MTDDASDRIRLTREVLETRDRRDAAIARAEKAEREVARLREALTKMLATHDGVHAEDCRACMAGLDEDLPDDPSDADPCCTCGATAVREAARVALSAGEGGEGA